MYVYIICTKKEHSFPRLASHSQTLSQYAVLHKAAQNIHTHTAHGEIKIEKRERGGGDASTLKGQWSMLTAITLTHDSLYSTTPK